MNQTERAKLLAKILNVEVRDGWYNVDDIVTVDGNPWVTEGQFLEIVEIYGLDGLTNADK